MNLLNKHYRHHSHHCKRRWR